VALALACQGPKPYSFQGYAVNFCDALGGYCFITIFYDSDVLVLQNHGPDPEIDRDCSWTVSDRAETEGGAQERGDMSYRTPYFADCTLP